MKNKTQSLTIAIAMACGSLVSLDANAQDKNRYNNGGYYGGYYGGYPGQYTQEGVINRAEIGAAASVTNLTASIPGAIMHERDMRLAREAQQQAVDQAEYDRTGIMSPAMKVAYEERLAAQNEADKSLSPQDLAEVKQLRDQETQMRQQYNPNFSTQQNGVQSPPQNVAEVLGNRDPNGPVSPSDMQKLIDQQQLNANLLLRLAEAKRVHQLLLERQSKSNSNSYPAVPNYPSR